MAGQIPWPWGSRARISKRPYRQSPRSIVRMRPDVKLRPFTDSRRAVMVRSPSATSTLSAWYH